MTDPITHRSETGREYGGLAIHAAPGTHEAALRALDAVVNERSTVLDVGAGSGAFTLRLREAGWKPTALDLSVTTDLDGVEFIEADVSELTRAVGPESYPVVVAIETVEHLPNPVQFLRDCLSVLQPGGTLLLTTPNVTHPYSRLKFAAKGRYTLFDERAYWSTGHITPLPAWLLRQHLRQAGFEQIREGRGGSFDMRGIRGPLVRALSAIDRSGSDLPRSGDGAVLIMTGVKSPAR